MYFFFRTFFFFFYMYMIAWSEQYTCSFVNSMPKYIHSNIHPIYTYINTGIISMYMYIYIYIYIYTPIHTYIIYIYMCVCMCVYILHVYGVFHKNSQRLNVLCCFCRYLHLRCLTGFLIGLCIGVYDVT